MVLVLTFGLLYLGPSITTANAASTMRLPPPVANTSLLKNPIMLVNPQLKTIPAPIRLYKVKSGDTLSLISKKVYGKAKDWPRIYWANKHGKHHIRWANEIYVGQLLKIPSLTRHIPKPPRELSPMGMVVHASTGPIVQQANTQPAPAPANPQISHGVYSYGALESLWLSAGGPSFAEAQAAQIAECESGGNPDAFNPSGASGLWQILGQVVPGNIFDPFINALNAVSKFKASGDTFAQWVCQ
jgi:LysM repeat protein